MKWILCVVMIVTIGLGQSLASVSSDSLLHSMDNLKLALRKSGDNLHAARSSFILGVVSCAIGAGLIITQKQQDPTIANPDNTLRNIGIACNGVALICAIYSWMEIGKAGSRLKNIE